MYSRYLLSYSDVAVGLALTISNEKKRTVEKAPGTFQILFSHHGNIDRAVTDRTKIGILLKTEAISLPVYVRRPHSDRISQ